MSPERTFKVSWHSWEDWKERGYPATTHGTDYTYLRIHPADNIEKARESLPEGATITSYYFGGHGPFDPAAARIGFRVYPLGACDVSGCCECIRNYQRDVNFPYSDEEEVFA